MFIRTQRLFLRPAWSEDAAMLGRQLADTEIQHRLAGSPWLEAMADPDFYLAPSRDTRNVQLLIFRRTEGTPQLVGAAGVGRAASRDEFGLWLVRGERRRGFAQEAGRAVLSLAFEGLQMKTVAAPALGDGEARRLIARLGFTLPAPASPFAVRRASDWFSTPCRMAA